MITKYLNKAKEVAGKTTAVVAATVDSITHAYTKSLEVVEHGNTAVNIVCNSIEKVSQGIEKEIALARNNIRQIEEYEPDMRMFEAKYSVVS